MRVFNISINEAPFLEGKGGKPLRVVFNIKKSLTESWSFMDLSIYNLADTVIDPKSKIVVAAGYDDNFGEIFRGTVISSLKEKYGVDTLRRIICRSLSFEARAKSYMSVSYGNNTKVIDVLQGIAQAWGRKLHVEKGAFDTEQLLVNGFVADGDIPKILNELSVMYNFSWAEDLTTLFIDKQGVNPTSTPIKIDMFHGLIGIPIATSDNLGVYTEFDCALNPKIRINGTIDLKSEYASFSTDTMYIEQPRHKGNVSGIYKVLGVIHTGDNYSNSWLTHVKGMKIG